MVYDDTEVSIVQIEIDPEALAWIYNNPESDSLHLAQFHFHNAHIDEAVTDIGFRLRGNTSRQALKKSFKISFNTFAPGRQFYGLDKMNLNGEHNDPAIVRSKLCWDWFGEIGLTASRAAQTAVYINGNFYGLYTSVEHIDEEFISRNYHDDSGNLWKCLWPADLTYQGPNPEDYHPYFDEVRPYQLKTNVDEYDYTNLAHFIDILNNTPDNQLTDSLETVLDVPDVLKYFASNVLLGSWDEYWFLMNNFYLYHHPSNHRMHLIPYDYDNTLGIDWFDIEWAETNPYVFPVIDGGPRPLATRLLDQSGYHNLYTHFLYHFAEHLLDPESWASRLSQYRAVNLPWAEIDSFRRLDYGFDDDSGIEDFSQSYDHPDYENQHVSHSILQFVEMRSASINPHLFYFSAPPVVYHLELIPPRPTAEDTIRFETAAFDEAGLTFVQVQLDFDDGATQYHLMSHQPVAGSAVPEDADRWTVSVPPLPAGTEVQVRIIAMDQSGNSIQYPGEPLDLTIPQTFPVSVVLNEFMARNDTTISDEFGEFDDWVELKNTTGSAVDLNGWYLSDRSSNLTKWQLNASNLNLQPGAYQLIWLDGQDEQGPFHAGFRLDGDGEFLALTAPDGITVMDSLSFGPQENDVSLARIPDGTGDWLFSDSPTPYSYNLILTGVPGDINGDETLDVLDVVLLADWIISGITPSSEFLTVTDMSEDNTLDVLDIIILVDMILHP